MNASYNFNFSPGTLILSGTYVWRDQTYNDIFSTDLSRTPTWNQIDLRVLWRDIDDRYTLIGFVRNATNEVIYSSATASRQVLTPNPITVANALRDRNAVAHRPELHARCAADLRRRTAVQVQRKRNSVVAARGAGAVSRAPRTLSCGRCPSDTVLWTTVWDCEEAVSPRASASPGHEPDRVDLFGQRHADQHVVQMTDAHRRARRACGCDERRRGEVLCHPCVQ